MPNFKYRALAKSGELVDGSIVATSAEEVVRRIEYLGLIPVETEIERRAPSVSRSTIGFLSKPRSQDVTLFTRDLALLLKAGARIDDALELLAGDHSIGRLAPVIGKIRSDVMAGEGFADAIASHPSLFPPIYVALARVGEAAGKLTHILEVLGNERSRAEATRRKIMGALQYPTFVLCAALGVLIFFVLVVLPQFSTVLHDFGAKTDNVIGVFFDLSDFVRSHGAELAAGAAAMIFGIWQMLRRSAMRAGIIAKLSRLPGVSSVFQSYRAALFCRNLGIMLGSDVALTTTLRVVVEIMAVTGNGVAWTGAADRVRHGAKLSDALAAAALLPPMAVRMLRLGEESGQLATLAGRIADFYETKVQRSLDGIVGVIGPLAIVTISVVVGGLIVSVMTALLSVSQVVG